MHGQGWLVLIVLVIATASIASAAVTLGVCLAVLAWPVLEACSRTLSKSGGWTSQ